MGVTDNRAPPVLPAHAGQSPAMFARTSRDVITVVGVEAISFLQGQLSQDIAGLPVGNSAWSFVLQPQGKVDAWFRVHRVAADAVEIDVDAGFGAAAVARIERFKLRTKCDVTLRESVPTIAVRGAVLPGGLDPGWPGVIGSDHLDRTEPPAELPAGSTELDAATFDALRIASGVPAMGAELTDATIPAEAGPWVIAASVSFTKGCYTGQELVARIDSRGGNVPRHLRGFTTGGPAPAPGSEVVIDGDVIGTVTSAAPRLRGAVGLAYVKRAVEPPASATIAGEPAELRLLPLV